MTAATTKRKLYVKTKTACNFIIFSFLCKLGTCSRARQIFDTEIAIIAAKVQKIIAVTVIVYEYNRNMRELASKAPFASKRY